MIKKCRLWLREILRGIRVRHRAVVVDDLPAQPRAGEVYIVGENGHFWCAAMMCPCRCGEFIQLNLVMGTRPVWTFEIDAETGSVTLRPSVWRIAGCRSHFLLRCGQVQWVSRRGFRRSTGVTRQWRRLYQIGRTGIRSSAHAGLGWIRRGCRNLGVWRSHAVTHGRRFLGWWRCRWRTAGK